MSLTVNIVIDDDVMYTEEFQKMKTERKLSRHINNLLRASIKVKDQIIPTDTANIEDELRELIARKVMLEDRKKKLIKESEEQAERDKPLF